MKENGVYVKELHDGNWCVKAGSKIVKIFDRDGKEQAEALKKAIDACYREA
jgi:hypothetical protein